MGISFDQLAELLKDQKPKMSWDDLKSLCEDEVTSRKRTGSARHGSGGKQPKASGTP